MPASGGAGTLTIATTRDCTWAASNSVSWIAITSATSGQGDGSVTYRVASNAEPSTRRGTIDVNSTSVAIAQEAAPCRFTVTPSTLAAAASGGNVTIQVQTNSACPWTAASEAAWIHVTAGATGRGDGSVTIAVDANAEAARSGRVIVAGTAVVVEQSDGRGQPPPPAPGCSYSIQPGGQTMAAAGGAGTIDVTASAPTCAWTAVSSAAWLTISGGASSTGSNRVTFNVAANPGASRTTAISVAGHSFTLTQAGAACSYSINPSNTAVAAAGGAIAVGVSAGPSCAWTTASNASWITIASGASGSGDGSVGLNVSSNPGTARTGTVTIAAQTFTVMQAAAPCAFALSPASVDILAAGGDATTNLTATAGCAWTAVSNAGWITVTAGSSGTGSGSVRVNATANTGPARSGTVTIGGQTLTVTQQAPPCTFAIAPTSQTIAAAGGSGSVMVTTGSACSWTAASNNTNWLTVTGGSPSTGTAAFTFGAAPNSTGASRVGTITVGGATFTLTQAAQ